MLNEELGNAIKENKKAYDDYTRKQLEAKQHRLELTGVDGEPKDLYFRYDRHGNLQTIYDYTTLEDAWVTSKKISLEEFKLANPTLSNREAKKQYFMSNDSKERFDSVEDYVNAWNQTKRNGYIVKQGPGIILDEFEVVTEKPGEKIPYNDFDSRRDYYNDNISKELFKNFAEGQVVPALEEIIPDEFTISEAVAGADYVTVMHNETGEEITIGVDYNTDGDEKKVSENYNTLVDFLSEYSTAKTIENVEKSMQSIHEFVREAEARPSNDPNSPGLSVEWMRSNKTRQYAST
jgi:hypothetical protein